MSDTYIFYGNNAFQYKGIQKNTFNKGHSSRARQPRARLELTPVEHVDYLALGVRRIQLGNGKSNFPPYVRRDIDNDIDQAVRTASRHGGLVLVTGSPAVGKTRSLCESMRRLLTGWRVHIPQPGANLDNLPGILASLNRNPKTRARGYIVWLDEIEYHVGPEQMNSALLSRLHKLKTVVLATMHDPFDMSHPGSERFASFGADHKKEIEHIGTRLLNSALTITVDVPRLWTKRELQLAAKFDDPRLVEAMTHHGRYGLPEYMTAGPSLWNEWRAAVSGGRFARGTALVGTAVDLGRTGLSGDLDFQSVEELHSRLLERPGEQFLRLESVEEAWKWALRVNHGTTSMIIPGYINRTGRAFEYLVDFSLRFRSMPPVDEACWSFSLAYASSNDQKFNIGVCAYYQDRLDISENAFRSAASSGDPNVAFGLGVLLARRGEFTEAHPWLIRAAEAGHADAANLLGVLLEDRGDLHTAEEWYRRAYKMNDRHADAAFNLGSLFRQSGNLRLADEWWRKAADAGDGDAAFNLQSTTKQRRLRIRYRKSQILTQLTDND